MEEVKKTEEETIDKLLTDDYEEPKKNKKNKKKKSKKSKKRTIIISLSILILLIVLSFLIVFFIPKIKLNGSKVIMLKYGEHYKEEGCSASYLGKDITNKVWYEGVVDETKLGKYTIKCKVRKNNFVVSKERIVEVVDKEAPVIELTGDIERYVCPNSDYVEEGYIATDNFDGDLTTKVDVKTLEEGIRYTVLDSSGNKQEIIRKLIKEDKTAPELTLKNGESITHILGNKFNEPGYTAIDNCDEDLSSKVKIEGSVDINTIGTYTLTYTVSDTAGNISKKERKVNVQKAYTKVSSNLSCGTAGTIYLTFDDGPNDSYTPKILDVLKKYGVKATFFVTAKGSDSLIKREYDEGHAIGVHTWTHEYSQIYASSDAFWSDFNKVQARIKRITGQETKIFRFPGGSSNTVSKVPMSQLANEAASKGYTYFDWNVSSGDSGGTTNPDTEFKNVKNGLSKSKGNVILMHDIKEHTMKAIENIVKYGLDNGYSFKVLDSTVTCRHATKR